MSKYSEQGAYHYRLFKTDGDPYRLHVLDVLERVKEHLGAPVHQRVLDVGCGEGLVVRVLLDCSYNAVGIEIDDDAIRIASEKNNPVLKKTIQEVACPQPGDHKPSAILMLDVLEHVKDMDDTVRCAQSMADLHFVAVPDRNDPGALRQLVAPQVEELYRDWECLHRSTRHARVFMVFKKMDKPSPSATTTDNLEKSNAYSVHGGLRTAPDAGASASND